MRPFQRDSWQALRAAHEKKPLIVHFWALSCPPCLAELPQWGRFKQEIPGLPLVLVNWDKRPESAGRIAAVLAKAGLQDAENWGLADTFEERVRFAVDRSWRGELPYTILIAKDGGIQSLSGPADFVRVRAWLADQDR